MKLKFHITKDELDILVRQHILDRFPQYPNDAKVDFHVKTEYEDRPAGGSKTVFSHVTAEVDSV